MRRMKKKFFGDRSSPCLTTEPASVASSLPAASQLLYSDGNNRQNFVTENISQTSSEPVTPAKRAIGDDVFTLDSSRAPTGRNSSAGDTVTVSMRGLRILRPPDDQTQEVIDIIFIHGLNGDSERTWKHAKGVYWPIDLLPKDIPNARILSFGYNADVTKLFGNVGGGTLRDHASTFVTELGSFRACEPEPDRSRKIVLVVHSLGGLVAQKALCISAEENNEHRKLLDKCTIGICFLGTPHAGSKLADFAVVITRILELLQVNVNRHPLHVLRPSSAVLQDLSESFSLWLSRNGNRFQLACFYEEHKLPNLGGFVVTKQSAMIHGHPCLPIPNHHRDMPKFSSADDEGYRRILGQIRQWLGKSGVPNLEHTESAADRRQTLENCIKALSYPEISSRGINIRGPSDQTCQWLSDHPSYKGWYKSKRGIVWILGHPGTGKSTLMKHAIQNSQKEEAKPDEPVCVLFHYFYNLGAPLQRSPEGFFRSILHQLLGLAPECFQGLVETHKQRKKSIVDGWKWEVPELLNFLEIGLSKLLEETHVRLYVDALDECRIDGDTEEESEDIKRIIKELRRLDATFRSSSLSHGLSICFACRHYPNLVPVNAGNVVLVERNNGGDLTKYIRQELFRDFENDRDFLERLQDVIENLADGSFMWAKLAIRKADDLYHEIGSRERIIKELQSLPRQLSKMYDRIMDDLLGDKQNLSLRLLQWVCFAQEPLSVSELRAALNIDFHTPCASFNDLEQSLAYVEADSEMKKLISSLSGGLAEVRQPTRWRNAADESVDSNKVHLIHQSVKDYLVQRGLSLLDPTLTTKDVAFAMGHYILMMSCVQYWTMTEVTLPLDAIADSFSEDHFDDALLLYSRVCDVTENPIVQDLLWEGIMTDEQRLEQIMAKIAWSLGLSWTGYKMIGRRVGSAHSTQNFQPREPASDGPAKPALCLIYCAIQVVVFLAKMRDTWPLFYYSLKYWILHTANAAIPGMDTAMETCLRLLATRSNAPLLKVVTTLSDLLHKAARQNQQQVLSLLLDDSFGLSIPVNMQDLNGDTALSIASYSGNYNAVCVLLRQNGIDVNKPGHRGRAPLLDASLMGHTQIVALLAKHNADLNSKDDNGQTALSLASEVGKTDTVEFLLSQGAKHDLLDNKGSAPLHYAIEGSHVTTCEALLMHGANVELPRWSDSPLALACMFGRERTEIFELLLQYGATVWEYMTAQRFEHSPIKMTIKCRRKRLFDLLVNHDIQNPHRNSLLFYPFVMSWPRGLLDWVYPELIDVQYGFDVNVRNAAGKTPLHCYIATAKDSAPNSLGIWLSRPDIDLNCKDGEGKTPLQIAIALGKKQAVNALLADDRVDADLVDSQGETVLMIAIRAGNYEMIQNLVKHESININLQTSKGTALLLGIQRKEFRAVKILLACLDIDPSIGKPDGLTPLVQAVSQGDAELVDVLLSHQGVNPNEEGEQAQAPLLMAARSAQLNVVRALLRHTRVSPNTVDSFGRTALSYAVQEVISRSPVFSVTSHFEIIQTLLARADLEVNRRDIHGYTPLDWALRGIQRLFQPPDTLSMLSEDPETLLASPKDLRRVLVELGIRRRIVEILKAHNAISFASFSTPGPKTVWKDSQVKPSNFQKRVHELHSKRSLTNVVNPSPLTLYEFSASSTIAAEKTKRPFSRISRGSYTSDYDNTPLWYRSIEGKMPPPLNIRRQVEQAPQSFALSQMIQELWDHANTLRGPSTTLDPIPDPQSNDPMNIFG